MPASEAGAQRFAISSLKAPVPQPTSSQCAFAGASSQARNVSPIAPLGASPAQLRAYTKAAVVGIGEIVLWIGYATGARVNARCKGPDQKEVDALVASFANS
jgi:hypothetical protein